MPRIIELSDMPGLVGQEIGVSGWETIDQGMIDRFADLTSDHQWIHVDVERAEREAGGTIAHGFLVLSMLPKMMMDIFEYGNISHGYNYGFNKIRFTGQVKAGSRIRLRLSVTAVEPKSGGLLVTQELQVEVEGAERPAIVAEWLGLSFGK
jgi:acyl dehydratase